MAVKLISRVIAKRSRPTANNVLYSKSRRGESRREGLGGDEAASRSGPRWKVARYDTGLPSGGDRDDHCLAHRPRNTKNNSRNNAGQRGWGRQPATGLHPIRAQSARIPAAHCLYRPWRLRSDDAMVGTIITSRWPQPTRPPTRSRHPHNPTTRPPATMATTTRGEDAEADGETARGPGRRPRPAPSSRPWP